MEAAREKLAAIGEEEAGRPVTAGGWSRKEILGHLVDSASNNHQRFVRCLLYGGLAGWPDYEQRGWVETGRYQALEWAGLVEFWWGYNRLLQHILAGAPEEKMGLRCRVGEWEKPLGEVAEAYVEHLEHHLEQILG